MICKKCGAVIPENSKFCPYCGTLQIEEDVQIEMAPPVKEIHKVSFKEAVRSLFTKLFVFSGRTDRREFNYGLLFLIIVSFALQSVASIVLIVQVWPDIMEFSNSVASGADMMAAFNKYMDALIAMSVKESNLIFSALVSTLTLILHVVFICAPLYRRVLDFSKSEKRAKYFTIIYVVCNLLTAELIYLIVPKGIYDIYSVVGSLLSVLCLGILLSCIFKREYEQK